MFLSGSHWFPLIQLSTFSMSDLTYGVVMQPEVQSFIFCLDAPDGEAQELVQLYPKSQQLNMSGIQNYSKKQDLK